MLDIKTISAIQMNLLAWYRKSARILPWRDEPTPYRVWVSEIMLQQTRVEAVKPYFERFMSAVPTVQDLAGLPDDQLMKLWEGLGYYSRARNLKKAAEVIVEQYGGILPGDAALLQRLPGIGPYTSGAVASIAYGVRVPAVDGNVLRVMARVLACRDDIGNVTVKKRIEEQVHELLPYEQVGSFNQALMELGATICIPNGTPKCDICPIHSCCEGSQQGIAETLPVKSGKKDRRIESKTVFVIRCGTTVAVRQRPSEGLLAGLWEFPNVEGHLSADEAEGRMRMLGMQHICIKPLTKSKHIFTHIEWHMIGYEICMDMPLEDEELQMSDWSEIRSNYSIPTAFKAYVQYLDKLFESQEE